MEPTATAPRASCQSLAAARLPEGWRQPHQVQIKTPQMRFTSVSRLEIEKKRCHTPNTKFLLRKKVLLLRVVNKTNNSPLTALVTLVSLVKNKKI
jgi:hypothetical protein